MQKLQFSLIWLVFIVNTLAQNYYPTKDVAFGQVAVGGGFETVINLTNRGTFTYTGTLILLKGENKIWNPIVNDYAISNGEYELEIQPQATVTLRLTGSRLESGAAIVVSRDLLLDNFIEANLNYFSRSSGRVTDRVGISPSMEFYLGSVPFQDFKTVALALVNGDLSGENLAHIDLSLFSRNGDLLEKKILNLGSFFHSARFLYELFPGQNIEGGKVEIASDSPIFGTALTLTAGELSSLPLVPSPVSYNIRMTSSEGYVASGELTLWAEGFFTRGYLLISSVDGNPLDESVLTLVNGQLVNGQLRLSFTVPQDPFFSEEATLYLEHDSFSFESALVTSTWMQVFLSDQSTLNGIFELNRKD